MKRSIRIFCLCTACLLCLSGVAFAADAQVLYHAEYCFTEADFLSEVPESPSGIFVTAVPEAELATIRLGTRVICPGDVLCSEDLSRLRLQPAGTQTGQAVLCYCPIYGTVLGEPAQVQIRVCSGKNQSPKAENATLETYKNIPNEGKLRGTDPEEGELSFHLADAPKRGTVELQSDGSYVYTPHKNKVGEDSFTFTVTDEAGNESAPATVKISILKPTDAMSFADMEGSLDSFEALWMQQKGLTQGQQIGEVLCFGADESVSRGEFLLMVMELRGIEPAQTAVPCFVDAREEWLQPYLTAALQAGLIRGESSEAGLIFRSNDPITGAEAAVMLQNALQLPVPASAQDSDAPLWARASLAAMADAGLTLPQEEASLSRIEAAKLLYEAQKLN